MARRIALHGFALLVVFGCVAKAHAQEDDMQTVADEAGVSVVDLAGAVNTTGMDARSYLTAETTLDEAVREGANGLASSDS